MSGKWGRVLNIERIQDSRHDPIVSVFQVVIALLAGNIIAAPVRALRRQAPYYMGIFTPGLGIRLMLASQGFRIGSLIFVGLIYVLASEIYM